tara:strand:+ start:410 stop:589 length:180 start_codon:yes stop_codon:yes gene_type:complete
MNLEQRVEALEQKLDAFFANEYPRVRNIVDKREKESKEEPLVIHGQGEYAKKIYPSDLK